MNNRRSIVSVGISSDESRNKRESQTLSLRKKARDEFLSKRRQLIKSDTPSPLVDFTGEIETNSLLLRSEDINLVIQAARAFRKMLSYDNCPPIEQVIESGIVIRLIECLYSPSDVLQYEALWCLTNIASGTHENTKFLIDLDVVHIFLSFFESENHKVREQAVWVIGNIAGDCNEFRDHVLEKGGMPKVLQLLQTEERDNVIKVATWTISNLCRGKPHPKYSLVKDAVEYAGHQIYSDDREIVIDALWTLSFLSDGKDKKQTAVANLDVADHLVQFLESEDLSILIPSLRIIGNLLSGDNETTQQVIDAGALDALKNLLSHEKLGIRKEACWSLSNVLAGTPAQIEQVIEKEIIPYIFHILETDRFDVRKEAAWCIANAVSGANLRQVLYFTYHNCIPVLCRLLDNGTKDIQLLDMTIDALERCLKIGRKLHAENKIQTNVFAKTVVDCGGHDVLDKIRARINNSLIYEKINKIFDNYLMSNLNDNDANVGMNGQENFQFNVEDQNQPYGI